MTFIKDNIKIFIVLMLLSIPASLPLLQNGFYEPHDLHHIADIYQMFRAFEVGQFPPRLAPDFLFNYGYPLFNFYYVLPFYLGALFFALGFALTTSFKLVFLTAIIASVTGMYLFLREFFGKWASIVGAILFLYTPYRAVQIYVRGAMGEALALSVLPFVLWSLVRLIKKPSVKRIAISAVVFSLFILSQNYFWFLSLPYIGLLIVILIRKQKEKVKVIKALVSSGILSLGITAYWWIPAVFERYHIDRLTPFLLIDHFPFIKQLILPSWGYGSSVWGLGDEISFQIGVVNLLVVLIVLILLATRKKLFRKENLKLVYWAGGSFIATVFLMNIRSLFVWNLIPFFNFIQFPWRLLSFTTFLTSGLAAILVQVIYQRYRTFGKAFGVLIIFGSIVLTVGYFTPSMITQKTDQDFLNRMFATRTVNGSKDKVAPEYYLWSEDYLLLPNWVNEKPSDLPSSEVEIKKGEGVIVDTLKGSPLKYEINVTAQTPLTVTLHKLYFPGWFARVDGNLTNLNSGEPYGQIELNLNEGDHLVEIYWKETNLRRASNVLTLFFLGMTLFLMKNRKYHIK